MADDVELGNPSKKPRLEGDFGESMNSDQAELENNHYSTFTLGESDLSNQRNVGEGGQTDDEHPETSKSSADPEPDSDNDSSASGLSNMSGLSGEDSWKPVSGPMSWVYRQMSAGMDPRVILRQIIPHETHIPDVDDLTLWKLIINIVCEPPPRKKLVYVNTLSDVIQLMKTCKNIMVLTGAGVSVSCGIPDFRSRNGVYARLAVDYPDLPDPQAMFDIHYFRNDQRPFFKFAKEIFPGQFEPSKCHKFIRLIEDQGKLLRNYTQNIDTLEQVAGITRIIQCHGSFASATCMVCGHKCTADDIKTNIMEQVIPYCPRCPPDTPLAVMKPDIVFFGESLPEKFHSQMAADKEKCDLLIVIGSSLKVRPVALIPNSLPPNVPQILINKEPLKALNFDVELLGDCDTIVGELCQQLGEGWDVLCEGTEPLTEVSEDMLLTPPATPAEHDGVDKLQSDTAPKTDSNTVGNNSGVSESHVDSSGVDKTISDAHSCGLVSEPDGKGLSDSNCIFNDSNVENRSEYAHRNTVHESKKDSNKAFCEENVCDKSTSGIDNQAADEKVEIKNYKAETENSEGADLQLKENMGENSAIRQSEHADQQPVQSEHNKEHKVDDSMEMDAEVESRKRRRTHTCSTSSSVCYGDKDTCGCSANIRELRKMWKPAVVRCSVAKRLGPNQYCFMPPSRYVFSEAEVYTVLDDSDSDTDSASDDLDDLSDIDGKSDSMNTSDEHLDTKNVCSENDTGRVLSERNDNNPTGNVNSVDSNSKKLIPTEKVESNFVWQCNKDSHFKDDTESSKESDDRSSSNEIQYTLATTSNELPDSLLDNMDHFANIGKDEANVDRKDGQNVEFKFDFELT